MAEFKLLVRIGCLELTQGIVGMDSRHVEQISFRQCVTFCEHRKLKGWQLHFQPTEAKSLVCGSHTGAQSVYGISKQILHATTPWPNPLLLCMRLVFFCSCKGRHGHDTTILQGWWSVPLSGSSSFWYE